MTKHLILSLALVFGTSAFAPAAFAQEHGDHGHDDHDGHDHSDHDHDGHDGRAMESGEAVIAENVDVEVDVLGVVCDFCAVSMSKTFKKREEVADVSVDLDTKVLSIAFKPGASLDDKMIEKLVTRSGYKTAKIRRKAA